MKGIILAAGMGTRLRPLTLNTPKSLIEIKGETLIERQIRFLREKGVEEIVVVTGYLAEKFEFLKDKYRVTVRHYLENAYVIDADNYLNDNFLLNHVENSTYFSAYKTQFKQEWVLHTDENQVVTDITIEDGEGPILCGVSYWNAKDGQLLQRAIEKRFEEGNYSKIYWDDIVVEQLPNIRIMRKNIPESAIYEIDCLEDLKYLHEVLK